MHITDSNGTTWVCLCKQWDGSNWVPIPEWIMYGDMWYMINYFTNYFAGETRYPVKLNNTCALIVTAGVNHLFPYHDPVPVT